MVLCSLYKQAVKEKEAELKGGGDVAGRGKKRKDDDDEDDDDIMDVKHKDNDVDKIDKDDDGMDRKKNQGKSSKKGKRSSKRHDEEDDEEDDDNDDDDSFSAAGRTFRLGKRGSNVFIDNLWLGGMLLLGSAFCCTAGACRATPPQQLCALPS